MGSSFKCIFHVWLTDQRHANFKQQSYANTQPYMFANNSSDVSDDFFHFILMTRVTNRLDEFQASL